MEKGFTKRSLKDKKQILPTGNQSRKLIALPPLKPFANNTSNTSSEMFSLDLSEFVALHH